MCDSVRLLFFFFFFRASLGAAGRHPWGWRRIQARRSTCLLLRALQRRRVESLVLGAHSSSPVHRALVLVLGTNIAVLLDCSKSSRQCSLYYLLTYLPVVSVLCCSTHGLYPFILLMHSLASFSRISYFRLGFVLVRAEHGPETCDGIGQGGLLQYCAQQTQVQEVVWPLQRPAVTSPSRHHVPLPQ